MRPVLRDNRRVLIAVVAVAFLLRLSAGLAKGPDFVVNGYTFYAELARTFWAGQGLCYQPGVECAQRMPLYPIVVAPFLAVEAAYPWLIVLHAALGALQPVFAYALAVRLFTVPVALVAAVGTALNPYTVIHGPSFQDTVVFNFLMSLAVLLLIWSADHRDRLTSVLAGLALALAMLTTIRLALFIPFAIAWVVLPQHQAPWRERVLRAGLVAAPVVILLGGWMARNARVVGAPVLTTEAGLSLWLANTAATLEVLPNRSIDLVEMRAWSRLSRVDRAQARTLAGRPVALDRFYGSLAMDHWTSRPTRALAAAATKVVVSFTGWLSPARDWATQLAYLLVFGPLNALALAGVWRARRAGPGHALVLLLFGAFTLTTAVFWAHTSHRSFLHMFKFVYAASVVTPLLPASFAAAAARYRAS